MKLKSSEKFIQPERSSVNIQSNHLNTSAFTEDLGGKSDPV